MGKRIVAVGSNYSDGDIIPICLNDVSGSENSGIIVSLVCTSFGGNSLNAGSINWEEFR